MLVDTAQPGFQPQEIHHKMGLHASDTASIALDDVFVADDALLGEVGEGFKVAMSALDGGRLSVAAGCVGICRAASSSRFPTRASASSSAGRSRAFSSSRRCSPRCACAPTPRGCSSGGRPGCATQGRPCTTETSIAKLYASEAAVWCANEAIQVHGGAGYVDDHPVERWFRDARVTTLYEGTSQIQQLIIGRALTGIDAMLPPDGRPHDRGGPRV